MAPENKLNLIKIKNIFQVRILKLEVLLILSLMLQIKYLNFVKLQIKNFYYYHFKTNLMILKNM